MKTKKSLKLNNEEKRHLKISRTFHELKSTQMFALMRRFYISIIELAKTRIGGKIMVKEGIIR